MIFIDYDMQDYLLLGSFLVVLTILDNSVPSAVEHCDMSVDDDAELGDISLFARVVALSRLLELCDSVQVMSITQFMT